MNLFNRLANYMIGLAAKRPPDFIIGEREAPYLLRWWLIPRNRFFNIYLHKFLRSDQDIELHDHPFWFVSLVLRGWYFEHLVGDKVVKRSAGQFVARRSATAHRIALMTYDGHVDVDDFAPELAWSLFITGPVTRSWGFHCPKGWRPWKLFVHARDHGSGWGCE